MYDLKSFVIIFFDHVVVHLINSTAVLCDLIALWTLVYGDPTRHSARISGPELQGPTSKAGSFVRNFLNILGVNIFDEPPTDLVEKILAFLT